MIHFALLSNMFLKSVIISLRVCGASVVHFPVNELYRNNILERMHSYKPVIHVTAGTTLRAPLLYENNVIKKTF